MGLNLAKLPPPAATPAPPPSPPPAAPPPPSGRLESRLADYRRLLEERRQVCKESQRLMDVFIQTHPRFLELKKAEESYNARVKKLEADIRDLARETKGSAAVDFVKVTFADPMRSVVDGGLLVKEHPDALTIPGLIRYEVADMNLFEAAVAAGRIPAHVAELVRKKERMTKAGRVDFEVDWDGLTAQWSEQK